jgi:DegV family protein with EDD domain
VTRAALCTDSSALFPVGVAESLGVVVVPVAVVLDGVASDDWPIDDFYARLAEGAEVTTSQPSPGRFLDAYTRAAAAGATEVLSIHLDARASGTSRSAELAARDAPIPVTVVDTPTVSFGVGLCVRAAARALADGAPVPAAAAACRALGATLANGFVARVTPGGRLPDAGGWALLEFADGAVRAESGCADEEAAVAAIARRIAASAGPVHAAVGHAAATTERAADELAAALRALPDVELVERYRVGAAVGAHTGPLSFGAFWWSADGAP